MVLLPKKLYKRWINHQSGCWFIFFCLTNRFSDKIVSALVSSLFYATSLASTLADNDNNDYINDDGVMWCLVEEQLFRSVEGQAASDEEEDKWTGDQQRKVDEVKRILTRLSCCGERYCTSFSAQCLKAGHHRTALFHAASTIEHYQISRFVLHFSHILLFIWSNEALNKLKYITIFF